MGNLTEEDIGTLSDAADIIFNYISTKSQEFKDQGNDAIDFINMIIDEFEDATTPQAANAPLPDIMKYLEHTGAITQYRDQIDDDEWDLDVVTAEELGSDIRYHYVIKNLPEFRKVNFHRDYWGSEDSYREDNEEIFDTISSYIGKKVKIHSEPAILEALLIDRQYNSVGHTKLLVKEL